MTTQVPRAPATDTAPAHRAVSATGASLDRVAALASAPAAPAEATGLPSELVAVDEALRAALQVAGRADEWRAAVRADVLAWVGRQRDVLAAVEAKVLTAERNAGTWGLRGDRDLAGFVGRTSRAGRGAGVAAVGQAGTLAAMPVVAEALVEGPVTVTHVAQITRATAASPLLAAELVSPEGQAQLVQLAARLDGGEFGKALAQLSASLDPAGRQRVHDEQRANRSFAWTHTPSGTLVKGRLDSVAGHRLAKAIDALCPRPTLDDDRSREMRQADALLALVERAAADKTTTPGALAPVQAILTLTQDTWTALRASHDQRAERSAPGTGTSTSTAERSGAVSMLGSAVDVIGRLRGVPAVTDETGQSWPASEVARALCDCALTRAVLGKRDAELNLGRESRAFKRQHWLALDAAGITGCQIPGCGMPLAYCQLHHITWWQRDGGLTNQTNCAAYCSFHHHEIHRLGIQITRHADGTLQHHHPDGRVYGGATGRAPDDDDHAGPLHEPPPASTAACLARDADGRVSDDDHAPTRFGRDQQVPRAPSRSSSIGGDVGSAPTADGVATGRPRRGSPPEGEPPLDLLALLTG